MSPYVLDYLSPSKLSCYTWCPGEFRQRYVERIAQLPDVPLSFGLAVHKGLETLYSGGEPDVVFRRAWRNRSEGLASLGLTVPPRLTFQGLHLIEQVAALGLSGTPERRVYDPRMPYALVPMLGFVDLWDEATHHVVDFKTTSGKWSQERADRETWQPGIYSYFHWLETDVLPTFEFVVLNRDSGTVQRFPSPRSEEQVVAVLKEAGMIAGRIKAQEFDCRCRDGRHDPKVVAA